MEGWDHKISATKNELQEIIFNANRINTALGSYRIQAVESDEKKKEFRRSIVLKRKIKKGEVIKFEDFKRPGGAFDPDMTEFIVGRTVNKDLNMIILTKVII